MTRRIRPLPARPVPPISRRGLIAGGVLAGVLAATGVPLQARSRGGLLRLGLSGGFDGWNPARAMGHVLRVIGQGAVHDCLTEVSATGELTGELATAWEAGPDARQWTIALRQGVRFHDGTPLVPEDVIASFAVHRDPASPAFGILSQIDGIEALGRTHLRFTLHVGNADFPFLLADPHLTVAPAARGFDGTGTGLYRVARIDPGRGLDLVRVAEHYKDGRAGWFDRVEVQILPGDAARVAALTLGRVDAVDRVPAAHRRLVGGEAGLVLTEVQGNARIMLDLPGAEAAEAFALRRAVDRAGFVADALAGVGSVAADHPLGAANQFLAPLAPPGHDPDAASWLAARLGADWAERLRLRLAPGRPTEDWAFSLATAPAGPWAALGADEAFRARMAEARASFDSGLRAELYAALQADCADRGTATVAAHVPFVDGHSRRLAHCGTLGSTLPLDGGRIAERWWMV
ncbi:MAG: tRNA-dihydrouridine synthase A [Rubellimicrobium sp.]|nr:tRNA-dihydrouridine synthase A [Rubellimicrobium sp.]